MGFYEIYGQESDAESDASKVCDMVENMMQGFVKEAPNVPCILAGLPLMVCSASRMMVGYAEEHGDKTNLTPKKAMTILLRMMSEGISDVGYDVRIEATIQKGGKDEGGD